MRALGQRPPTAGAVAQLGFVAHQVEGGGEKERPGAARLWIDCQLVERPASQLVEVLDRMAILGHPLGQLRDQRRPGGSLEVGLDPRLLLPQHLGDDVEVAAVRELDVDLAVDLQCRGELGARLADTPGDGADLAVLLGQEGVDPIRLAVVELAEHDRLLAIRSH